MDITIYQQTKVASRHSNEPKPKSLSKTPTKVESKTTNWLYTPRRGEQQSKRKAYGQNTKRGCQKSHRPPLIWRAHLDVEYFHLEPLAKNIKNEISKAKKNAKNLATTEAVIELSKGGWTQKVSLTKPMLNICEVEQTTPKKPRSQLRNKMIKAKKTT